MLIVMMMMSENKNRAISLTEEEGIAQNGRGPAVRETSSWPSRGGGGDRAFGGGRVPHSEQRMLLP